MENIPPAGHIDPIYASTLRQAIAHGVEAIAYAASINPNEIILKQPLPVVLANEKPI